MKKKSSSSDSAKNQRLEHASNNSNSSSSRTNNNNSNNNKTDLNSNHIGLIPNQFEEIVPPNEHVPNPALLQSGPYECKSCHSRFVHDYQVEFPIVLKIVQDYLHNIREVVRGVAGVAAATPFFEPEKIRNFVISFLRLIDSGKKILLHHFKILTPSLKITYIF